MFKKHIFIYLFIIVSISSSLKVDFHCRVKFYVRRHAKITHQYKSTLGRIIINLQIVPRPRGLSLIIA